MSILEETITEKEYLHAFFLLIRCIRNSRNCNVLIQH